MAERKSKQRWMGFFKAALGLGLLLALFLWDNTGMRMLEVFAGFDTSMILALVAVGLSANFISSAKWNLFLRDFGIWISQAQLFGVYLIGRFFNNFLPSMVGGDVARSYLLGKEISSQSVSAASVIMERVTGMVALVVLAALFYWLDGSLTSSPVIWISISGGVVSCSIAIVLFYWRLPRTVFLRLLTYLPVVNKLASKFEKLFESLDYFRDRHQLLALSMLYSVGFHLLASVHVYVAALAVGLEPSFLHILVITPVVLMLSIIPVSPNNVGYNEWLYSLLFAHVGASTAEGLAVALTIRANTFAISLIGGLLMAVRKPAQGES